MSISTYSELQTAIADWLLRDDLTSAIPNFIQLAEAQFNREIRDFRMIKRADASIDSEYSQVPSDWVENIRFQLNTSPITTLEFVTADQAAEEKITFSSAGQPRFFTMIGDEFQVVPAPDSTYTGELTYYSEIPSLSDSNTTNWLLTNAPDIYLYGALIQSAPYLQDDSRLQTWTALYAQARDGLRVSSDRSRIGSSALRMRPKAMA